MNWRRLLPPEAGTADERAGERRRVREDMKAWKKETGSGPRGQPGVCGGPEGTKARQAMDACATTGTGPVGALFGACAAGGTKKSAHPYAAVWV